MIDQRTVTDAVLVLLRSDGDSVGDLTAPNPAPTVYAVLERPPGTTRDGTLGIPERSMTYRFRVRSVARAEHVAAARQAAEALAHRCAELILDRSEPLTGTGWTVTSRAHLGSAGVDDEGPLVNVVDDYELWVVPAATPSPS